MPDIPDFLGVNSRCWTQAYVAGKMRVPPVKASYWRNLVKWELFCKKTHYLNSGIKEMQNNAKMAVWGFKWCTSFVPKLFSPFQLCNHLIVISLLHYVSPSQGWETYCFSLCVCLFGVCLTKSCEHNSSYSFSRIFFKTL